MAIHPTRSTSEGSSITACEENLELPQFQQHSPTHPTPLIRLPTPIYHRPHADGISLEERQNFPYSLHQQQQPLNRPDQYLIWRVVSQGFGVSLGLIFAGSWLIGMTYKLQYFIESREFNTRSSISLITAVSTYTSAIWLVSMIFAVIPIFVYNAYSARARTTISNEMSCILNRITSKTDLAIAVVVTFLLTPIVGAGVYWMIFNWFNHIHPQWIHYLLLTVFVTVYISAVILYTGHADLTQPYYLSQQNLSEIPLKRRLTVKVLGAHFSLAVGFLVIEGVKALLKL